jgi:threonine dehydrogenase-like Zn-dependent dehydrogenase
MGAADALTLDDHYALIAKVSELTDGRFCDVVIEAVGKAWPLDLAAELTRERGRLVIAGYHQDGPRQINMQLWNWRGLDVVNAHERDPAVYAQGVREAVEAVGAGQLNLRDLVTHAYPLEQLDQALDATRDRPDGFLKAVVTM